MPYSHKCPQCGKPVDPLRARAVALIDGQFLYFCSMSCRERQRAGREQTLEVTSMQIVEDEPPASPEPGGGSTSTGLHRWALAAIVVLATAVGIVMFLFQRM